MSVNLGNIILLLMCYLLAFTGFRHCCKSFVLWWAQQDSNLRPADYEVPKSAFRCCVTACYKLLQATTDAGFPGFPSPLFKLLSATEIVPSLTWGGHKNGHSVFAARVAKSMLGGNPWPTPRTTRARLPKMKILPRCGCCSSGFRYHPMRVRTGPPIRPNEKNFQRDFTRPPFPVDKTTTFTYEETT